MNQFNTFYKIVLQLVRQKQLVSLLVLEILLISCSPPVPAASPTQSSESVHIAASPKPSTEQTKANAGQVLPISAQVKIADQLIQLEVARTPEQQEMGLMYRTNLPNDRGMLFPFSPPRPVGFWMKNCNISLDMIFLLNGKVQSIASNAPPCKKTPARSMAQKVPSIR